VWLARAVANRDDRGHGLPAAASAGRGRQKALSALEESMKPVSRVLFAPLLTDDG